MFKEFFNKKKQYGLPELRTTPPMPTMPTWTVTVDYYNSLPDCFENVRCCQFQSGFLIIEYMEDKKLISKLIKQDDIECVTKEFTLSKDNEVKQ